MDDPKKQIQNIIREYVEEAINERDVENPKVEFKRQWYNLKDRYEISEFLKDVTAIANTPGPDGYLVIGFDSKARQLFHSNIRDSGLRTTDLNDLLVSRVSGYLYISYYPVKIKGYKIDVLHIPPSFEKPHVIKRFEKVNKPEEFHRIFIRRGDSNAIATKWDIDYMYYDKKNIIPEYDIGVCINSYSDHKSHPSASLECFLSISIENMGRRTLAISELTFHITVGGENIFINPRYNKAEPRNTAIHSNPLLVRPSEICVFESLEGFVSIKDESLRDRIKTSPWTCSLTLINGKSFKLEASKIS